MIIISITILCDDSPVIMLLAQCTAAHTVDCICRTRGTGSITNVREMISVVGTILFFFPVKNSKAAQIRLLLPVSKMNLLFILLHDNCRKWISICQAGRTMALRRSRCLCFHLVIELRSAASAYIIIRFQTIQVAEGTSAQIITAAINTATLRSKCKGIRTSGCGHGNCTVILIQVTTVSGSKTTKYRIFALRVFYGNFSDRIAVYNRTSGCIFTCEAADISLTEQDIGTEQGGIRFTVTYRTTIASHQASKVQTAVLLNINGIVRTDIISGCCTVSDLSTVYACQCAHIHRAVIPYLFTGAQIRICSSGLIV